LLTNATFLLLVYKEAVNNWSITANTPSSRTITDTEEGRIISGYFISAHYDRYSTDRQSARRHVYVASLRWHCQVLQ
jgi:hypothetical protein